MKMFECMNLLSQLWRTGALNNQRPWGCREWWDRTAGDTDESKYACIHMCVRRCIFCMHNVKIYKYVCACMCVCIYIYIYIYTERERERERERCAKAIYVNTHACMCVRVYVVCITSTYRYVRTFVFVCLCLYVHTNTHTNTHTWKHSGMISRLASLIGRCVCAVYEYVCTSQFFVCLAYMHVCLQGTFLYVMYVHVCEPVCVCCMCMFLFRNTQSGREEKEQTCLAIIGVCRCGFSLGFVQRALFDGNRPLHLFRKWKCSVLAKAAHESVAFRSKRRILRLPEGVEGFAPFLIFVFFLVFGWTHVDSAPPPMMLLAWSRGVLHHVLGSEASETGKRK